MSDHHKLIKFPAILLWALGYKAKDEGIVGDYQKILNIFDDAINKNKKYHENDYDKKRKIQKSREFINKIKNISKNTVIPFEKDQLDIFLAAIVYAERVSSGFKIKSNRSFMDGGFIRVHKSNSNYEDIEYVDTIKDMIRGDLSLPVLFDQSQKNDLVLLLENISNLLIEYETINNDQGILRVIGDFSIFSKSLDSDECAISLLDKVVKNNKEFISANMNFSRNLGKAKLNFNSINELFLTGIKPEILMEMTAASQVDRWLLIESTVIKALGKLPDLTLENDKSKVFIDPSPAFSHYLLGAKPWICIDKESAFYFSKKYKWCVPNDSRTWLESII